MLVPNEWVETGVEGADPPTEPVVGQWVAFGDAQTANLDKANGRTRDSVGIIRKCEKRDREALRQITKKWYEFWI